MKKYSFVLVLLLAVNILYAQNAYQSVLDQIETNSTVLSSVTKQYDAMKAANNARSFVENPELEGAYKWGVGEAGNGMELNLVQEIEFPTVYSNKKKIRKINNTIIDAELEMQHYEIMYQVQQLCLDLIYNKRCSTSINNVLITLKTLLTASIKVLKRAKLTYWIITKLKSI